MPKIKNSNPISLYSFHLPLMIIGAIVLTGAVAVTTRSVVQNQLGSVLSKTTDKQVNTKSQVKSEKSTGKPTEKTKVQKQGLSQQGEKDTTKYLDKNSVKNEVKVSVGKDNASVYKTNVKKVITALDEVSQNEDTEGNTEVSDEIENIADDIDENETEDVADAIGAVESRPKWQTILIGSDYKNLGQLRSSLVHTENSIRKLNGALDKVENPESAFLLQAQIASLEEERARIGDIIKTNESQFSLLGWAFRFLSGYTTTPNIGGSTEDTPETSETTGTNDENESTETTTTGSDTETTAE